MAEVHIIGQIIEALDFREDRSIFVKWSLESGSCWEPIEGYTEGQTHLILGAEKQLPNYSIADYHDDQPAKVVCHPLSHPIDVHYVTRGLQGWPRLDIQVWGVDWMGKSNISAYGFASVPSKPGYHELTCYTWRPVGDFRRRFIDYLTGHRMHLLDPSDIVSNGLNRHVIQSQSMGTIRIGLTLVLKDFEEYGVDI